MTALLELAHTQHYPDATLYVVATPIGNSGRAGEAGLRRVGGQRDRGQARTLALETADERRGEVLRGGGRRAVTARDDLVAVRQRGEHRIDRGCDRQRQRVGRFGMKRGAVAELLLNTFD